jgi:hypothetical protein
MLTMACCFCNTAAHNGLDCPIMELHPSISELTYSDEIIGTVEGLLTRPNCIYKCGVIYGMPYRVIM